MHDLLKYFLPFFTLFMFYQTGNSQIELVPLKSNPQLAQKQPLQAALNDHFISYLEINIQAGKTKRTCIDLIKLAGSFDTLQILRPFIPSGGVATVQEECIVYEADPRISRISDTLELLALDVDSFEYHFQLIVNVIPSRQLPFVDDFSYQGPYPDDVLWLDDQVFINNGLAKDPLSIGVATMDGVDERGTPYGLGEGSSDTLTSVFINLEGIAAPVFEFYYQPRGRGFSQFPREKDSLIVELRGQSGKWVNVLSFPGIDNQPTPDFKYTNIPLVDSLRYDGFQFRFRNLSRRDGILGTWHLDYVQVRDASVNREIYPDVALKAVPTSLFKRYTAIPSAHFKDRISAYIADSNYISIGNYFPGLQVLDDSRVLIKETLREEEILMRSDDENLLKSSANSGDGRNQIDLNAGQYYFRNSLRTRSTIISRIQSMQFEGDDSLNFEMTYTFENSERTNVYERNNTIKTDNWVNDYYAYDDGTAERGIYIEGGRGFDMIAQQFESPVDDSLKAVRMFFPHVFGAGSRQRFKLMVWGENLEDGPIYEKIYDGPIFPDRFGEILGSFTTFGLTDDKDRDIAVPIPAGIFYVGWQQISASNGFGLYVGFDYDNPETNQYIRYNIFGTWDSVDTSNEGLAGALMIRPVFGPGTQRTTAVKDEILEELDLFPNPAYTSIRLRVSFSQQSRFIQIVDIHGREILRSQFQEEISVRDLAPGLYILRVIDSTGQMKAMQKFVKQ